MRQTIRGTLILCALALFSGAASAEGAGGLMFGVVEPGWKSSILPEPSMPFDIECIGGFGYGVTSDGFVIGGFGFAFMDSEVVSYAAISQKHVAGGVGGLIVGQRVIGTEFIHLDAAIRLGLGGMGIANLGYSSGDDGLPLVGYAIFYGEPYLELGVGLLPWLHLCADLGYPIYGNFIPGKPFQDVCYYSPSLTFSLSFGNFSPDQY